MNVDNFFAGQKVTHKSRGEGRVVRIGEYRGHRCVEVEFPESRFNAQFDDDWFRINPGWLKPVE